MRISDWSSDVCSSDLLDAHPGHRDNRRAGRCADPRPVEGHRQDWRRMGGLHPARRVGGDGGRRCGSLGDRGARSKMGRRSEEHTSELQSLMRISYAVFCLKKNKRQIYHDTLYTMQNALLEPTCATTEHI